MEGTQPFVKGLRSRNYGNTSFATIRAGTATLDEEYFLSDFETNPNFHYYDTQAITGYFSPPETGNYRFYLNCDDKCQLDFTETPYDSSDPVDPTYTENVAYVDSWMTWREYAMPTSVYTDVPISDWFYLEQGSYYPIRGLHYEETGSDYFAVGLEQEDPDSSAHSNANPQIQRFDISIDATFEEWELVVLYPDGGNYYLTFADTT